MEDNMFWLNWMEADELERIRLIKTLPVEFTPTCSATIINSYLVDLFEAVKQFGFDE